jgi:predicted cation transporter
MQASKVTAQGLQVAAVLGVVLTAAIWAAAPNLVSLMRGEPSAMHQQVTACFSSGQGACWAQLGPPACLCLCMSSAQHDGTSGRLGYK